MTGAEAGGGAGSRPTPGRVAATRILLLDGRSGAGKSQLARLVAARLGADVLGMDDLYPGWDGLAAGAETAARDIVAPLARGERARWRRWDWLAEGGSGAFAEEHVRDPGGTLVLEGCGAITPATAACAALAAWIDTADEVRRERALRRDLGMGAGADLQWWPGWRLQEEAFYRGAGSADLAELRLDGSLPPERLADLVLERLEQREHSDTPAR